MVFREPFDAPLLAGIGILVLVNQDMIKASRLRNTDLGVLPE